MKLINLFFRQNPEKVKELDIEDQDFLIEQASIISGQLRGSINQKAHDLNKELILSKLMEISTLIYNNAYEKGRQSNLVE